MTFMFYMHFISNSQLTPISYIFQLRQHSARPSCALIITVNIFNENGISLSLSIVPWLWSQPSSLTERISDNQLWTTLVRNNVPQVAIYQTVTFPMPWGQTRSQPMLGTIPCDIDVDELYIVKNWIHCATHLWRRHHTAFIHFDTIPACDVRAGRNVVGFCGAL